MRNQVISGKLFLILMALFGVLVFSSETTFGQSKTKITIVNGNAAGVGFNDPTAATPVGGNPGTTLGQQRLNAFQRAADLWGATLDSRVPVTILAQFAPLACTATGAVLGSAGATQ